MYIAAFRILSIVLVTMLLSAEVWSQQPPQTQPQHTTSLTKADYDRALSSPADDTIFQEFLDKLPKVTLADGQLTRTFYLLEGDLLVTRDQVRAFLYSHAQGAQPVAPNGELRVMSELGLPVFWGKDARQLTYAVDRRTFPTEESYSQVVKDMAEATNGKGGWIEACKDCGLSFQHRSDFDSAPTLQQVTFIVTFAPNERRFIAAAFFPNDPVYRRYLVISPQYFTTSFSKVGVLRHEVGHVLGYRHEHIVGIPGCGTEDNNWIPLTPTHDKFSVMHYFCGGGGTMDLRITDSDRDGHQKLYR